MLDLLKNKYRGYCIFKLYLYIFVNNLPLGSGTMVNTMPLGSGNMVNTMPLGSGTMVNTMSLGSGTMVNTLPLGSGINRGSKILEIWSFETRDPKYLESRSSPLFDFVFAFSNLISVKSLKPSYKN